MNHGALVEQGRTTSCSRAAASTPQLYEAQQGARRRRGRRLSADDLELTTRDRRRRGVGRELAGPALAELARAMAVAGDDRRSRRGGLWRPPGRCCRTARPTGCASSPATTRHADGRVACCAPGLTSTTVDASASGMHAMRDGRPARDDDQDAGPGRRSGRRCTTCVGLRAARLRRLLRRGARAHAVDADASARTTTAGACARRYRRACMRRFGLGDRWAYHALHDDGRCYGMSERAAAARSTATPS